VARGADPDIDASNYNIFVLDELVGVMEDAGNIAGAFSISGGQASINTLIGDQSDIDMILIVESNDNSGIYGIWHWNDSPSGTPNNLLGRVDASELTKIGQLEMSRLEFAELTSNNFQIYSPPVI
jgi:hypothetical protein